MGSRFHISALGLAACIGFSLSAPATGCAEGEQFDPSALGDGSAQPGSGGNGGSMQTLAAGGSSGTPDTNASGGSDTAGSGGSSGGGDVADSGTPGSGGMAQGGNAGAAGSAGAGNMPMDAAVVVIPPDAPLANGVVVFYHAGNTSPMDDTISFYFQVVNNGTTAIPLSALKIRYYFTDELNGAGRTSIYESFAANYPTEMTRTNYSPPITKETVTRVTLANSYLEFTVNSTDQLQPKFALTMQVAYAATGGQPLDETNDYSANLSQTSYAQTTKIVVFQGDTVIAGATPPY